MSVPVRASIAVNSRVNDSARCAAAASPANATSGATPTDTAGGAGKGVMRKLHQRTNTAAPTITMNATAMDRRPISARLGDDDEALAAGNRELPAVATSEEEEAAT